MVISRKKKCFLYNIKGDLFFTISLPKLEPIIVHIYRATNT